VDGFVFVGVRVQHGVGSADVVAPKGGTRCTQSSSGARFTTSSRQGRF
jgi:hypothetical protein